MTFSLLPVAADAQYKSVHVIGSEPGKGTAVSRGRDCFVITAAHVVRNPEAVVVGEYRKKASAVPVVRDEARDFAVLRVREAAEICGADHYVRFDVTRLLREQRGGVLRVRDEDGSEDDIPLTLPPVQRTTGDTFLAVGRAGGGLLGEGHSGAMFFIAGEPAGIMTGVTAGGVEGARMLRIDRISQLIATVLPLEPPEGDLARIDRQVAVDMLAKNVNFVHTPAFCLNLWRMGKWIANPAEEAPLRARTQRLTASGGDESDVESMLITAANTVVSIDPGRRRARTLIGYAAESTSVDAVWRSLEGAIDRCLRSDTNDQVRQIRLRSNMRREPNSRRTTWALERTGRGGVATEDADVWLDYFGREITLQVWAFD